MMLGAGTGSVLELTAEGQQADEALDALSELIANRFEEEE
jgi:phosphocarrier protein